MEKIKYKLKGHESFVIRDGWLTKGLRAVHDNSKVFSENNGADALGVGTNMARAIRYWLRTSGLTRSSQTGEVLTELGEILFENDLYFEDSFSIALVHANIATNFEAATSWSLFFNDFLVSSPFTRDEMFSVMKELFTEKTGNENPTERSLRDDCSAILAMYAMQDNQNEDPEEKRKSPFEDLALIARSGNRFVKKRPALERIDPLVILYLIVDVLNAEGSIQIDRLTDGTDMPGKIFNLNRISVNNYLDELQNSGYIIVNRTAGLDIVYPASCDGMSKEDAARAFFRRKS